MPDTSLPLTTHKVWDRFVRLFHWTLVILIGAGFLTAEYLGPRWLTAHAWLGAAAAALIAARLIWGGLGGQFARFSGFVTHPRTAFSHLKALHLGGARRYIGHNPLGGWMILALLISIFGLAATGALQLGGVFKAGPARALLSYDTGEIFAALHAGFANLLIGLILLHVAGAIYESLREKDNLVRAMITGRKTRRAGDILPPPRMAHPGWTLGLIAALGLGAAASLTPLYRLTPAMIPVTPLDAAYKTECGDCHMAFHPSLMPALHWQALMRGLGDHFGEDASLDPATREVLTLWLMAHASETADTKPAHVLSQTNPLAPLRPSHTPYWQARHADLPKSLFTTAPVYSPANCGACHRDAETGAFYPPAILVPTETTP